MRLSGTTVVAAFLLVVGAAACAPLGLGLPSTRQLETGAASGLDGPSFEVAGSYTSARTTWTIDLQLQREPPAQHIVISSTSVHLEALITSSAAYYRGHDFVAAHLAQQPAAAALVAAAGDAWWRGPAGDLPQLPDLTSGAALRSTFLGSVLNSRQDGATAGGVPAVELSGPRGDLWIAADPPHQLLRARLAPGATIDGITNADLRFSHYGDDFNLQDPTGVISFSDLSSLPPLYTVVSVDVSGCKTPCVVTALLRNLGGLQGAQAPSTVTFSLVDSTTGDTVGTCMATVTPDVGYNDTTHVSCTIQATVSGGVAKVTAVPTNPGRGG